MAVPPSKEKVSNDNEELPQPTIAEQRPWLNLRAMFSTSTEHDTKRAMQSRHLMMIGAYPSATYSRPLTRVHSYRGYDRDGHLPQCRIGELPFVCVTRLTSKTTQGGRGRGSGERVSGLWCRWGVCVYGGHHVVRRFLLWFSGLITELA